MTCFEAACRLVPKLFNYCCTIHLTRLKNINHQMVKY